MEFKQTDFMQLKFTAIIAVLFLALAACEKEAPPPDNPFDNQQPPDTLDNGSNQLPEIPDSSFAWLHERVFLPTCANSGCHDGTFEPDFRTINSTYHTLVNHPALKTDTNATPAVLRVAPYQPANSMLYYRLTTFLPNSSGIMPLNANDSDWEQNKDLYLQKIYQWIQNGAPNAVP
ncbi:hypothetical protein C7N43_06030 [Sphingobacteriales bacterium UPWRP_1]|nr:hypothetical protein BVG80_05800 [Sphingobacteriales bacterium TSM_CSM]PSJ78014.1 hypothetical protein C7N43_06030 [Sphingobacteriales bacterium UPWRP_1]